MPRSCSFGRISLGLLAAIALAACSTTSFGGTHRIGSAPYEQGSGKVATESRSPGVFHAVSASSGVEVFVSTGSSAGVSVTADDNLLGHITTDVRDGTLLVSVSGSIETDNRLKVAITTASPLDAIGADAGATVDTENLDASDLAVRVGSGATLRAGGTARSLDLAVSTGATADLRNVASTSAHVQLDTGSTAFITASERVSGNCTTGSTLHVAGGPTTFDVAADITSTVARE